MFHTKKRYPYTPSNLEYLANKTSLFLLDYFHQVFRHIKTVGNITDKSWKKQGKKKKEVLKYKLAALNEEVDVMFLPTGYSTSVPPSQELCDNCFKPLSEKGDSTVLICGHGFHWHCYDKMEYGCRHCEQYYKNGIYKNVNSFLKRLEKGANNITEEDGIEESQDSEETEEDTEEHEFIQERDERDVLKLQNALEEVDKW
ncbi:hypothetical protein C2G38_1479581 [Gigaspora rosea]|uniref:RING-type domain-containing protein n=1 Tax=Gigaspora rosea TaxID=44941 RepID=A0A397V683_9GLOM|nr:hypothetical protein C2G38_1479581 [Gigaspora rosea]